MFTNESGKIKNWIKIIASSITIFFSLGGAFLGTIAYLDNTFVRTDEMRSVELKVESDILATFEKHQRIMDTQQRILDMRYLEHLQYQKIIMEKEIERDPDDKLIKFKLEIIKRNIIRIEKDVYQ